MNERKNEASWSDKHSRWTIKVQRNGDRRSFYSSKKGRQGKLEAERKADEWLRGGERKEIRVGELCKRYLASIDIGNGSAHLQKERSVIKNWILPYWQHMKASTLTNRDYQDAVNRPAQTTPPRSARTCGHVRSTISALYAYAVSDRIEMEMPLKLKIPKAATKQQRTILQTADMRKLFTEGENYFYIYAFRFIALLGLRRGELCGLINSDISGDTLTINRSINSSNEITNGKTAAAQRTILLPKLAQKILIQQRTMLAEKGIITPWVFPNTGGRQINTNALYGRWQYLRRRLDLPPVSIHELRHTMISTVKADMPLPLLQETVGHVASMDTIGVYGHEREEEAKRSADLIDEIYKTLLG